MSGVNSRTLTIPYIYIRRAGALLSRTHTGYIRGELIAARAARCTGVAEAAALGTWLIMASHIILKQLGERRSHRFYAHVVRGNLYI